MKNSSSNNISNMDTIELKPKTVYVQDYISGKACKLYTLDLKTGSADLVGAIATDVYDLAFVGSQLYGLQQQPGGKTTNLVKIDRATGKATVVNDIGFHVVGLAYNRQRDTLYATAAKQLIAIDLETGKGKPVVTVSKDKRGCGEVAFDSHGRAYITLIGTDKKKHLASCDLDSGKVKVIGNIGFPDLASMEFIDDVLYGVTGNFFNLGKDGQLIRIDIQTGKGTLVTKTTPLGRWAGMTIYEPATVPQGKTPTTVNLNQQSQTTVKEDMKLLTIDTKENCYVIDPNGMNELQQNVASSFTFDKGTYEIQITSGRYSFAKSETEGELLVLLWLYGENGSTFINNNTGFEVGATWTTLHGYNDRLQLEVKDKAVLCALFFDVNNSNNSGSVDLSITSQTPSFPSQRLTVDSHQNCYVLDEKHLSSLKHWDRNFIELDPGNYRIKIREGNASYWSDNKKFDIEPWALIWIKAGKFVPKLTGTEVGETWCSLNGFQDEFILEVKQKTTLSGFFFDTYKEDNEGQIVLAIEPISAAEVTQAYEQQLSISGSHQQVTATSTVSTTEQVAHESQVAVGASGSSTSHHTSSTSSTSYSGGSSFSFHFNEAQMEEMWQKMIPKIEASVTVKDEQDEKKEAYYWDNLEKWILKGYQTQAKELAMQVARLEFMMKTITQQMEVSFNQNFQAWSSHFDDRLNNLLTTRITNMVDEQIKLNLSKHSQDIKNLVVEQMQSEVDKRIDTIVNLKVANLSQDIKKTSLEQIEVDLDKRIANTVNVNIADRSTEINNAIVEQIHNEMDERINSVVNLKISDRGQEIKKSALEEIQADLDKRIDAVVNLKITDLTPELNNLVVQQIQGNMDQRIDTVVNLKVANLSQDIKQSSLEQIKADLDRRIANSVNVSISERSTEINNSVIEQIHNEMDERINTVVNLKTSDQNQEIKKSALEEIQADLDKRIDAVVNLKITDLTPEINTSVVQQIQGNIDQRIDAVVNLKTNDLPQNVKNLVIQQIQPDIDRQIVSVVDKSTENNVQVVANNIMSDIDNHINVNFDNKILNFRDDVTAIVKNEINHNNESISTTILSDITNQQFFLDMQTIKAEVDNFYARLGQFETQLNLRIKQGDNQLYNWTLEQLVALQGCLTDRQALAEMFESFASNLKNELDNAACVQPSRFTPMTANVEQSQIAPATAQQLPGR
ncbi:MAG: hypothetical protein QNJ72_06280 [Pleurocapsa sp. MO_226.B13]|nr:hypothetical protein [Pleurocapsa sp. MO_226.B13]